MALTTLKPATLRLGRYDAARRLALIAVTLVGSAAFACAATIASRSALYEVVRACVLDASTTGSPLPCLKVGPDFIVLRPPIGRPDTILAPSERIAGIEDPKLQQPDTPNYFALAWDERRWLGERASDARVALAVNSVFARSQDQLHIHIGCVTEEFSTRFAGAIGPRAGEWFRGPELGTGLRLWSYRSGGRDFAHFEPFRLLKALVGDAAAMRRTTLAVVLHEGEFVAYALTSQPGGAYAEAEDVLRTRC